MAVHLATLPPADEHIARVSVPLRALAPSQVLAPLALDGRGTPFAVDVSRERAHRGDGVLERAHLCRRLWDTDGRRHRRASSTTAPSVEREAADARAR